MSKKNAIPNKRPEDEKPLNSLEDLDKVLAVWMLASLDTIPLLTYRSVALRLYPQIIKKVIVVKNGKASEEGLVSKEDLDCKAAQVKKLVEPWRELFRLGVHPDDLDVFKNQITNSFDAAQKADPALNFPEWLKRLDVSEKNKEEMIKGLSRDDLFRSHFRPRLSNKAKSDASVIKFGIDYIESKRSAILDKLKEDREAERHKSDFRTAICNARLAVLGLLLPLLGTCTSSFLTYCSSERANVLKETENGMMRRELTLREVETLLRNEEADAKRASSRREQESSKREREARFVGTLTRLYAAFLSRDKNECISLLGESRSVFAQLDTSKQNELKAEYENVLLLCIEELSNPDSRIVTRRRTDIENVIEEMVKRMRLPVDDR